MSWIQKCDECGRTVNIRILHFQTSYVLIGKSEIPHQSVDLCEYCYPIKIEVGKTPNHLKNIKFIWPKGYKLT